MSHNNLKGMCEVGFSGRLGDGAKSAVPRHRNFDEEIAKAKKEQNVSTKLKFAMEDFWEETGQPAFVLRQECADHIMSYYGTICLKIHFLEHLINKLFTEKAEARDSKG